jgi:hypothetical protein
MKPPSILLSGTTPNYSHHSVSQVVGSGCPSHEVERGLPVRVRALLLRDNTWGMLASTYITNFTSLAFQALAAIEWIGECKKYVED